MAETKKIISFINDCLEINKIKDSSLNGLQIEGTDKTNKIVFGVSASLDLFSAAEKEQADMIIVHHGLIWDKPYAIKGHLLKRIKTLLNNNINLLAYHLPLDSHPEIGNNAQIVKLFNVKKTSPFGVYKNNSLGFSAKLNKAISIPDIEQILIKNLDSTPITFKYGNDNVTQIAVVSGGGADLIYQAAEQGIELYISGESGEYTQAICKEYGINFIGAGHYNSEKLGIIALEQLIKKYFKIDTKFIDIPNPI